VYTVTFDGPADQGIAQIVEDGERFVFHFVFPGYVPSDRRPAVAEFVLRANWRLIEGNFQMDFESGALRYATGIDFSGVELEESLVRNAILSGMNAIETFAEGLEAVLGGQLSPAQALTAATPKTFD
jgi:hypothetical protein